MEKIFIDDEKLKELPILGSGKEGTVYEYSNDIAIKIFNANTLLHSKFEKIALLHNAPIEYFATIPKKLVATNTQFGYSMKNMNGYTTLLELIKLSYKSKISILFQIKEIIEIFHNQKDIIIGDIRYENILVKQNDLVFCDVDNFKIGDINPEILNIYGKQYFKKYQQYDEGLDIFSFNILSLLFIFGISNEGIVDCILNTEKLENPRIKELFMSVLEDEKYTKEYFIDGILPKTKKRKLF